MNTTPRPHLVSESAAESFDDLYISSKQEHNCDGFREQSAEVAPERRPTAENAPRLDSDALADIPFADLSHARQLHAVGLKLCALHDYSKRPVGDGWNTPEKCVQVFDETRTGYGFPLAINGRCSIDPDQVDLARIAFNAWGFNYEEVMSHGVRTASTRPGSGGRSQFVDPGNLTWVKLRVKMDNKNLTVLELRAGSPNLQDVVPGLLYKDSVGNVCTQNYSTRSTFLDAPELPTDFMSFWKCMSNDIAFRMEQEKVAMEAFIAAGHKVGVIHDLSGGGLPFPDVSKKLRAAFNEIADVETLLEKHGYIRKSSGRWSSPDATGAPGIRLIRGHESLWQSDHGSDPLNGTFDAAAASIVLDFDYDEVAWETWALKRSIERDFACDAGASNSGPTAEEVKQAKMQRSADSLTSSEITFMPLRVPDDSANPIGSFFRTAPKLFPMDCVPKVLCDWAENQSAASGFDPGAYLYIVLMAFSGWLDQRSVLRVTSTYSVPPYQWAGLVDDSGGGKSPVLNASNFFIEKLNAELVKAGLAAAGFRNYDVEVAAVTDQLHKEAVENGRPPRLLQRIIVDATVEAIAEIAASNPEGLMYLADDVSAWLGKMDAYGGSGKDRGFYLGLNDRKQNHPINRKGKPPIFVESLSAGMIVGMQPGVVVEQMKNGGTDDGLFQRFLLYMMAPAGEANFDAAIDTNLNNRILGLFRSGHAAGQIDVAFNSEARQLAEDYLNAARHERHANRLSQSHANKLTGYTFRLSLSLHVLNCLAEGRAISPTIGLDTLGAAADIIRCLRSHAFAIYEMVVGGKVLSLAQYALEHIVANRLTEFTQADLSKNNRDWATTGKFATEPAEALELLFDRGVIANGGNSQRGRRAVVWKVNPELHNKLANATLDLIERRKATSQHLTEKFAEIRAMRNEPLTF